MNLREVGLRLPLPAPTVGMDGATRAGGEEFTLPVPTERAPSRVASTPSGADATQAGKARADSLRGAGDGAAAQASDGHTAEPAAQTRATGDARRAPAGSARRDDQGAGTRAPAGSGTTDPTASMPSPDAEAAALDPVGEARPDLTEPSIPTGSAEAAAPAVAVSAAWLAASTPANAMASTAAPVAAATALTAAAGPAATPAVAGAGAGVGAGAGHAPALPVAGMADEPGSPPANAPATGAALLPGLPAATGAATAATRPSSGGAPRPEITPVAPPEAARTSSAPSPGLDAAALLLAPDTTAVAAASAVRGQLPAVHPAAAPAAAGPEAFAALVALSAQAGHAAPTDERTRDGLSALIGLDAAPPAPTTATLSGPAPLRLADPATVVVPGTVALPASPEAGFDDAFGDKVVWIVEQRLTQAEMRVSPEGLGAIEVRLQLEGHKLSAQFNAAHPDVRQALEAGMGRLRDLLGQHGMELADSHVGQQNGGGDRPPSRQSRGDDPDGDRPALVTTLGGLRARGLIDLYA